MPQGKRILAVDDEASVADALALVLGERGHKVETARSASEAEALLKARPFDLVFIDLRLPDGSGIDLLPRVKTVSPEKALVLAARALQFKAVKSENRALKGALAGDGDDFGIVGHHPKVRQIRE